jgi:hypothetical protein
LHLFYLARGCCGGNKTSRRPTLLTDVLDCKLVPDFLAFGTLDLLDGLRVPSPVGSLPGAMPERQTGQMPEGDGQLGTVYFGEAGQSEA